MNEKYIRERQEFEEHFKTYTKVDSYNEKELSPSKLYELSISTYSKKPDSWFYSRGVVTNIKTGIQIADIKRNYPSFWYAWVLHQNGSEYLLCGEDYQGYTVINLTKSEIFTYFPDEGFNGNGFCWASAFPSPDGLTIAVDGCYWACPYDLVLFDFQNPECLPLKEISRVSNLEKTIGWKNNDVFVSEHETAFRKSDGHPYDTLSKDEKIFLDYNEDLIYYAVTKVEISKNG